MYDADVETVKLGARGQMVLPARVRKELGLSGGDEVLLRKTGNVVVVTPKPKSYAERLFGLHRQVWEGVDPDAYVRKEREQWES
ncbi:MAG: AbrB/MazE/SpoVT family DNA-binding domain-containing protein [Syntrophothermus sp.]|uniref:AbrB/MazE/SpoVT family DNA-binding domain-containing protein n=1 Tax=Syntrophothermus sp. TaxID=2736299 RepID=UPI00257DC22D|nr:AbrB/MazE/SpoVT family DNA-binding domain-containing protein [Syntrophothermus sp.]NSW84573.1 AbrB/MazE/SpoVT family DNA-binding domain-containing protein [Syntrophothermus sp.]